MRQVPGSVFRVSHPPWQVWPELFDLFTPSVFFRFFSRSPPQFVPKLPFRDEVGQTLEGKLIGPAFEGFIFREMLYDLSKVGSLSHDFDPVGFALVHLQQSVPAMPAEKPIKSVCTTSTGLAEMINLSSAPVRYATVPSAIEQRTCSQVHSRSSGLAGPTIPPHLPQRRLGGYAEFCADHGWNALPTAVVERTLPDIMLDVFHVTRSHSIERDGKKSNRGWRKVQLLEATELPLEAGE